MVNIYSIGIVVLTITLFAGLIYLVYMVTKRKQSDNDSVIARLTSRIRWTYVTLLAIIGLVLFCFKSMRTPGKGRLEQVSGIVLPADYKVLRSEYQDLWPHYCILYDVQFDNVSTRTLVSNIRALGFYDASMVDAAAWNENEAMARDSVKAVWYRSQGGYDFVKKEGINSFSIEFDTVRNVLKYSECVD